MLIAHYVGNHAGDDLLARAGWYLTRNTQRGQYKDVTHVEAILGTWSDGKVDIGSASLRDGACVRIKERVALVPGNWRIAKVDTWSMAKSLEWFAAHRGEPYDWRGALATRIPGHSQAGAWFCNQAVAAPFLKEPQTFGPHHFAAITFSLGVDWTEQFFAERAA